MLKVKDLIEKLKTFHEDAEVYADVDGLSIIEDAFETWDDCEEARYQMRKHRNGEPFWEVWLVGER